MSKSSSTKVNQNYGADRLILPYINLKKTKRGLELVSLDHFLHEF